MNLIQDYVSAMTDEATNWLGCGNKKSLDPAAKACFAEIVTYEGGNLSNEAWCAKFVWMVLNKMCILFGMLNPIKKTASTIDLKAQAEKRNIPVDRTPAPGCIFFRYRTGGGHVGMVTEVVQDIEFRTIEGNSDNQVKQGKHSLSEAEYYFIHVETLFEGKSLYLGLGDTYYYLTAAGVFAWWLFTYFKYDPVKKLGLSDKKKL